VYPDPTQFDPESDYFDSKATRDRPVWELVEVEWLCDFKTFVSLEMMRADPALAEMIVLRRGNRLSITPVTAAEFKRVCRLGGAT
jgi:predicted RNA-binding protein with PUA-like domain